MLENDYSVVSLLLLFGDTSFIIASKDEIKGLPLWYLGQPKLLGNN